MSHPHELVFLRRKWLRRLGITALVLIVLGWLGHVPERRDRVFRAMPENSLFVSEHLNLSGVWRERFDNPLLVQTLQGAGIRKVEEWSQDTNIVWIVRLVSGRRSLIGWSPALGPGAEPCWTGASWAGWRGPLLRTMLAVRWVPGLGRLQTTEAGTRYLYTASRRRQARGEMGEKVAFYLRENILLATLGDDPDAVRSLDWRVVHDAPLAPIFRGDPKPWQQSGCAPHRCWLEPAASPLPLPLTDPVEAAITKFTANEIALSLRAPHSVALGAGSADYLSGRCAAAEALAPAAAAAILYLPATTAHAVLNSAMPGLPLVSKAPATGSDAALYITTQALGGKVFNLGVPAMTLLYPEPTGEAAAIEATIEMIAARSKLPLRIRPEAETTQGRRIIDWLPKNKYIRLATEDCTVVELHPGWLTLCTSLTSLEAQRRFGSGGEAAYGAMLQQVLQEWQGVSGFCWLDLLRVSDELRHIYAVYRLATSLGAVKATVQEADLMDGIRRLVEATELRGSVGLAWRLEPDWVKGELRLRSE